jgi:sugar/nucleoside kinase (ribokinase family)
MRTAQDKPHVENIGRAAAQLLAAGVKQRVVIHCPEGAWGETPDEAGAWIPSRMLSQAEIVGSVGAGDAFCAGFLYGCHEAWPLAHSIQLAHACARASLLSANAIDGAKTLEELQLDMAL